MNFPPYHKYKSENIRTISCENRSVFFSHVSIKAKGLKGYVRDAYLSIRFDLWQFVPGDYPTPRSLSCVYEKTTKKKIFFSLLSQWWRLLLLFKFFVRRLEKKKICHPILILESDPTKKELFSSDIPHLSTWNGIFHHWDDQ